MASILSLSRQPIFLPIRLRNFQMRQFGGANPKFGRAARSKWRTTMLAGGSAAVGLLMGAAGLIREKRDGDKKPPEKSAPAEELPLEVHEIVHAPNVPPPIRRSQPVRLRVHLEASAQTLALSRQHNYRMWTFNGRVPGPFIRARQGDLLEVHLCNRDDSGIAHNVDFHAVIGPGGGSQVLLAEQDETKSARFRLLYPGLFLYHCATAPIPMHIANGMYGLILVEPPRGLPPVDREFYVMQSEFYTQPANEEAEPNLLEYSYTNALDERPQYVVFNGKEGALTDRPLQAKCGERVRIFFGNAGPNLASAFHSIGAIFEHVYRDGSLLDAPARGLQTTLVAPGSAAVVELDAKVPGTCTLVDHAIHRIDKGAVGFLKVAGAPREDIYAGDSAPVPCPGCKLHE